LSAELERVITTPGARLIVSFSPQEGKSSALRWAILRKLQLHPERRNVIASYAVDLARTSGRAIRQIIDTHGSHVTDPATGEPVPDRLGISVARDHSAAADWTLAGHTGGLICVGVGSGLTGRPIDGVLAVDDPLKDARDADSALILSRLHDWWTAVSETRLAPESSVVVIATRWAERDLSGWLIEQDQELPPEQREWRVVNIPALADGVTPDALNRPVGEWMESARGRTPAQWEKIRRRVGERVFAALYQGRPAPLEGGVFKVDWFNTWRVPAAPGGCLPPTVVVDPADNEGDGDEAGIIVATTDPASGKVYILDDLSAAMTVARWARTALLTCVRRGAPTLAFERSLSQLPTRIREAWARLHQQAVALHKTDNVLDAALKRLVRPDDPRDQRIMIETELAEIIGDVEGILRFGDTGPRLRAIVAKGSKQLRMQLVAPMFETGRAVMVGKHSRLEWQASLWQPGQDSPDRVDAMSHACSLLSGQGASSLERSNERIPTSSVSLRNRPVNNRITRSVRR